MYTYAEWKRSVVTIDQPEVINNFVLWLKFLCCLPIKLYQIWAKNYCERNSHIFEDEDISCTETSIQTITHTCLRCGYTYTNYQ